MTAFAEIEGRFAAWFAGVRPPKCLFNSLPVGKGGVERYAAA